MVYFPGGPAQKLAIKEEPLEGSRASSEQGEEEMEVDSNEEQDEENDQKDGVRGGAFSQNLSALNSLRPGEHHHQHLKAKASHVVQFTQQKSA